VLPPKDKQDVIVSEITDQIDLKPKSNIKIVDSKKQKLKTSESTDMKQTVLLMEQLLKNKSSSNKKNQTQKFEVKENEKVMHNNQSPKETIRPNIDQILNKNRSSPKAKKRIEKCPQSPADVTKTKKTKSNLQQNIDKFNQILNKPKKWTETEEKPNGGQTKSIKKLDKQIKTKFKPKRVEAKPEDESEPKVIAIQSKPTAPYSNVDNKVERLLASDQNNGKSGLTSNVDHHKKVDHLLQDI